MARTDLYITWEIEGRREMSRRLENVRVETDDFQPAFRKSVRDLKRYYSGPVFQSQGGVIGEPWPPLSPFTLADKARKGFGGQPTLVRTGSMKGGFETEAKKKYGVVWNSTDYFKYHQSRRPRTKIPRRPMMKLDEWSRQTVIQNFRQHLARAVRKK